MTTDKDWIEWKWTPGKPYPETLGKGNKALTVERKFKSFDERLRTDEITYKNYKVA